MAAGSMESAPVFVSAKVGWFHHAPTTKAAATVIARITRMGVSLLLLGRPSGRCLAGLSISVIAKVMGGVDGCCDRHHKSALCESGRDAGHRKRASC